MATTGLEVRIHEGRERSEVTRVLTTLNEVVLSLKEIDHVHLLHGTRATWVMADMRRDASASELVMRLETQYAPKTRTFTDLMVPVNALVDGALQLREQASVPSLFAPNTVTRIGRLAVPRGGIQSVALATYNGKTNTPVLLDDAVKTNADKAVEAFEVSWGTVTGRLSSIQDYSQRRKNTVRVTLRVHGEYAVYGFVPASKIEEIRDGWLHRVVFGGKIRRNAKGQPINIEVEQIERLPEDNSGRVPADDLLGAAAGWLDGLTVDEFMRQVRDV